MESGFTDGSRANIVEKSWFVASFYESKRRWAKNPEGPSQRIDPTGLPAAQRPSMCEVASVLTACSARPTPDKNEEGKNTFSRTINPDSLVVAERLTRGRNPGRWPLA